MDDELTHKYAANISQLAAKARSVIRDLDPQVRKRTATGDGNKRARACGPISRLLRCRPMAVEVSPMGSG